MRLYEAVYILDAALDEAAINEKLEKFHALAIRNGGEVVASPHGEIARWTGGGARAEPPFPDGGKNRAFNWWTDNTEWAPARPPYRDMWHDWGLQPCEL